jgi:hypothetical protein
MGPVRGAQKDLRVAVLPGEFILAVAGVPSTSRTTFLQV